MNRTITSAVAALALLIALTGCTATPEATEPVTTRITVSGNAGITEKLIQPNLLIETTTGSAGAGIE